MTLHALGKLQLVERVAQLVALLAFDAARDAAASRVVGIRTRYLPAKEINVVSAPLGAALVLLDLDDQLLALAQRILDAGAADVDAVLEVAARDFLERQKPCRSSP